MEMKALMTKLKIATIIFVIILILVIVFSFAVSVPAGFIGIRTQFGAVVGDYLDPGLNFKAPFVQDIKLMDCRVQKVEVATSAASKDLQTISSTIAVNYSINPEKAIELYKEVGFNYSQIILEPALQEVVKKAASQYTAEELITKRGEVSELMAQLFEEKVSKNGIIIENFNIVNFEFSAEYDRAIEQKQVAQQNALKAQQDLERIKIEAEQKIVQAKAEAESYKLQNQEITEKTLRKSWIEKWDGKLPTFYGEGGLPIYNMN